jgi:ElaB/YqjD/DUF883 family membrane-anchored ribosome-binding protein
MSTTTTLLEGAGSAQAKANETIGKVTAMVEEGAQATSDMAKVQVEKLETMIRANPLAATGIAAAVGFLVALLARRA